MGDVMREQTRPFVLELDLSDDKPEDWATSARRAWWLGVAWYMLMLASGLVMVLTCGCSAVAKQKAGTTAIEVLKCLGRCGATCLMGATQEVLRDLPTAADSMMTCRPAQQAPGKPK